MVEHYPEEENKFDEVNDTTAFVNSMLSIIENAEKGIYFGIELGKSTRKKNCKKTYIFSCTIKKKNKKEKMENIEIKDIKVEEKKKNKKEKMENIEIKDIKVEEKKK